MKIVRHGNLFRFICDVCRCTFDAGSGDCTTLFRDREGEPTEFLAGRCTCPECGNVNIFSSYKFNNGRLKEIDLSCIDFDNGVEVIRKDER